MQAAVHWPIDTRCSRRFLTILVLGFRARNLVRAHLLSDFFYLLIDRHPVHLNLLALPVLSLMLFSLGVKPWNAPQYRSLQTQRLRHDLQLQHHPQTRTFDALPLNLPYFDSSPTPFQLEGNREGLALESYANTTTVGIDGQPTASTFVFAHSPTPST